jgi:hypothetical protein
VPDRSVFRNDAIKRYMQSREKDVLPRIIPVPVAIFLWALLGVFIVTGVLAWYEQVPLYVMGTGIVLDQGKDLRSAKNEAMVFLPPDQVAKLHIGLAVQVHIDAQGPQIIGKIAQIGSEVISPDTACQRYGIEGASCLLSQPSVIVLVELGAAIAATRYAGSSVTAEVEVGTQRILSLLPGVGNLIGE